MFDTAGLSSVGLLEQHFQEWPHIYTKDTPGFFGLSHRLHFVLRERERIGGGGSGTGCPHCGEFLV
ncbi:hypothetical protein WS90_21515 [Burkholderia cepacia]|uniref:Uncharacterized protein n=1 Tax=Burkholderia cepacia TaxID=292 RepID=A0A103ZDM5_BURCE|nr:hypothetical protein WS90_21515 [Burkholderia cepacia]